MAKNKIIMTKTDRLNPGGAPEGRIEWKSILPFADTPAVPESGKARRSKMNRLIFVLILVNPKAYFIQIQSALTMNLRHKHIPIKLTYRDYFTIFRH
ncbi:MAG: hypothetical protein A2X31_12360 [Elusimicrobia bacterium GWB2_63_22]|nr:MAG: hypothetical protein A2X31_12360 [Elusimicrobia bacterium GWB2_63_22]